MKIHNSLDLVWPPFAELVSELIDEMHHENYKVIILESYRSPVRQNQLFAKGRVRPGKIITNARGWQSWHQYGLAVDLIFDSNPCKKGIQGPYSGDFELLGRIAQDLRMEWGGRWGDKGHVQYRGGVSIDQARSIQAREGILGLWGELDRPIL